MSTRCRIGIENKDGTITSIYCHHDGYISGGVGEMLAIHYTDEAKVRKLMELGDISSLGTEPVSNPNAWKTPGEGAIFSGNWNEIWHELHPKNMCDAYESRGEDCPAETHKDIKEYKEYSYDCGGEFTYLYKDGKWQVLTEGFTDLVKALDEGE